MNIILQTDSYKVSHASFYPKNTQYVYSYLESRSGSKHSYTVFNGLQYIIKKYLTGEVVTQIKLSIAMTILKRHLNLSNQEAEEIESRWQYIIDKYAGRLPLEIKAVREGSIIPTNNVLMTVENTDPKCYWLTNYVETLLTHVWYPCNIATIGKDIKHVLTQYSLLTDDTNDHSIEFQLHDFGYRSASSEESASVGGAAHLLNFSGTDTIAGITHAMHYYEAGVDAFSVHATEHSIMTAKNEEGEMEVFKHVLDKVPNGILSVVIDSYNYVNFIQKTAKYKEQILARDGKLVYRPDSGNPVTTTISVLKEISKIFGHTVNSKGYKVLCSKVGMLWGDGIDSKGITSILAEMADKGWASSNIVFGMGGALLQNHNRDTQRFAFKCCAQKRDGVWYDICKRPIDLSKASKKGRLALKLDKYGRAITVDAKKCQEKDDLLKIVLCNGQLYEEQTFKEIKERCNSYHNLT